MTQTHPHYQHNFRVNMLDGGFFGVAAGIASLVTIVPLLVNSLTDSTLLIGLISAISTIGWQLPQLLVSNHVAGVSVFRNMVLRMTFHERLPYVGLAVASLLMPFLGVGASLVLIYLLLTWQALGKGLTGPAWQSMVAKIIPENRRGTFVGVQYAAVSLMSSIGAVAGGFILANVPYPFNFSLCFFIAAVMLALSYVFIWKTRESPTPPRNAPAGLRDFRAMVGRILREDGNFRWFLLVQLIAQFSVMAIGFLTVYAVRDFGMDETTVGIMTAVMMMAQMVSGPISGWLGDRLGHRRVYAVGLAAMGLAAAIAIALPTMPGFVLVFSLTGFVNAIRWTNALSLTMEFGTETQRPYYIGMANTLITPATLVAPLVGGAVADIYGFDAMFWLTLGASLLAAGLLAGIMADPRTLRTVPAAVNVSGG